MSRYAELNDTKWLRSRYIDERMGIKDIATTLGCSMWSVHTALKRHGIPARASGGKRGSEGGPPSVHVGKRYGALVIIRLHGKERGSRIYAARCDCGGEILLAGHIMKNGRKTHCGCRRRVGKPPIKFPELHNRDWLRQRYEEDGLGMEAIAAEIGCSTAGVLKALRRADIAARPFGVHQITHGHATGTATPTYRIWIGMRNRCNNPNNTRYAYYGGRGIRVCDRWNSSYAAFLADMGPRPEGRSIDRIDVNGNYEPSNCRWATQSEQIRNRRPRVV